MTIYTDGANKGNGKESTVGAWGFIVVENDQRVYSSAEVTKDTTNNKEELKAVINALKYCNNNAYNKVKIVTDSQYVQQGITEWIKKWEKNGWRTSDKKPVKNKELWQRLKILSDQVKPEFEWTKGHAEDKWNIEVDKMINETIKNQ